MGIDVNAATFLCYAATEGVSFERTATLGRQNLNLTSSMLHRALRRFGRTADLDVRIGDYAEPLFQHLGALSMDSFDASSYEGATIVHDLNTEIPKEWHGRYTVVFDGGTLEHVFDFPRAISNAMQLTALGGHYLATTPTNSFSGHGFYQFSPELYFRIFSSANGFRMIRMLLYHESPYTRWYEVTDPQRVGRRVTIAGRAPAYLAVLAQRTELKEPFRTTPVQSDYQSEWAKGNGRKPSALVETLYRRAPGFIRHMFRPNPSAFHRVDLARLARR